MPQALLHPMVCQASRAHHDRGAGRWLIERGEAKQLELIGMTAAVE